MAMRDEKEQQQCDLYTKFENTIHTYTVKRVKPSEFLVCLLRVEYPPSDTHTYTHLNVSFLLSHGSK